MRAIALCLLSFTMAASAGNPEGAPELEKLRTSYKAAVAKGTRSIVQSYIATLEKLRDIYARGANLAAATKVQANIDRANVAMSTGEFIPPATDANNTTAPELDKLRAGHEADIERALKPYRETYVRELGKLRDNYTRAANLPAASAVQAEIDASKPDGAPGKPAAMGDEKFFVNKSWTSPTGVTYHFEKGGTGDRTEKGSKSPFTWRKLGTGLIETSRRLSDTSPATLWYFRFDNRETALSGSKPDDQPTVIHIEK